MKKIHFTIFILFFALAFSSCTQKMNFVRSSIVPGAEGYVKVKKDKNNNYNVTVTVANLAKPGDLAPPREVYIVWMHSDRNEFQKLGQIVVSTGLLSSALNGELTTTTTIEPTRVFITAEQDANVENPLGETVLTTR